LLPVMPPVNEKSMPIKPNTTTTTTGSGVTEHASNLGGEEYKDSNLKYNLSKFEHDLYHEEDDISEAVIRVKRVSMPNKGERWKVMHDNKVTFTIESPKISKKEREYLQTLEGFNFILARAKIGIKSLNSFRTELKKEIDKKTAPEQPAKKKKSKRA
jgi:SMC interacting uncharacterized protein involved in chromosome segregation